MYKFLRNLADARNFGGLRSSSLISWLIFHYTANDGDTDEANANYFAGRSVGASAHYFVDDDSVTQSVPEERIAFAVGGAKWADCPLTGGGRCYGRAGNYNSISIEMCDTRRDGRYDFSEATLQNAAELGAKLIVKYGIPLEHVICHFDVNGKHCPGVEGWFGKDRSEWLKFKERVFLMTGKEIYEALVTYLATLPESGWSVNEGGFNAATDAGLMDGTKPQGLLSREQLAAVLFRAGIIK